MDDWGPLPPIGYHLIEKLARDCGLPHAVVRGLVRRVLAVVAADLHAAALAHAAADEAVGIAARSLSARMLFRFDRLAYERC